MQFSVVKVALGRQEPAKKFLSYALSFLNIYVNDKDCCFAFDFEPASTTPFCSSSGMGLIESIKIFGMVRMELAGFINLDT